MSAYLTQLKSNQRKHFKAILKTCELYRGEIICQKNLLKTAGANHRSFYGIIWQFRSSLNYEALSVLREALNLVEIEDPTLERAIRSVDRILNETPEETLIFEKEKNQLAERLSSFSNQQREEIFRQAEQIAVSLYLKKA